jgi:hypothetical protein
MAYGIGGLEVISALCGETIRKNRNCSTAAWKRKYSAMPSDVASSVTQVLTHIFPASYEN